MLFQPSKNKFLIPRTSIGQNMLQKPFDIRSCIFWEDCQVLGGSIVNINAEHWGCIKPDLKSRAVLITLPQFIDF